MVTRDIGCGSIPRGNVKRKALWKRFVRKFLDQLGITRSINSISYSNLYNLKQWFLSRRRQPELIHGDVVCIMCTWGEELMAPLAIESSKDFVSRYIVVDKDGTTVPAIKKCRDDWGLDMSIYVKPSMNLREARAFAASTIDEPWVLVQDGDEVFHTDGPNSIESLRVFMDRPNITLCAPMIVLCGDLLHTRLNPKQPPHSFLYHNNGTIRAPYKTKDLLTMDGWSIILPKIYKFNCLVKNPRRMFLRQFWKEWCQDTDSYLKYPTVDEYVSKELGIDIEKQTEEWYEKYMASLVLYDETKWGYYPEVIRKKLQTDK